MSNCVLSSLVAALEFGGASATAILPLVLQFGASVSQEEYSNVVLAPLIKLFASPDRGMRMALLENLDSYSNQLDKKTVSEKIFPHLVSTNRFNSINAMFTLLPKQTGFSDTVAVIREMTVKSIPVLAPKVRLAFSLA
jgi:SCY1-like protein 1